MTLPKTIEQWIPQSNSPLDDPAFVQAFLSIAEIQAELNISPPKVLIAAGY
jgi:hypothetical protein